MSKNKIVDRDEAYIANVQPIGDTPTGAALNVAMVSEGGGIGVDNPLQVQIRPLSVEDLGNSTTTSMLALETWEGTPRDVSQFASIGIFIHSDEASEPDGFKIWFSPNGIDDWEVAEEYTVIAGAKKFFTPTMQGIWYKLTYQNDGIDQTVFHVHTVLRTTSMKFSSHNINQPITGQDDAELVLAVSTGLAPDGTYKNVLVTNQGNQKISIEEFETAVSVNANSQLRVTQFKADGNEGVVSYPYLSSIAEGEIPNHSIVDKFGANTALNTTTYEDIWDGGGVYPYPADNTAPITHLYSTVGGDTQDIEVQGLDITGALIVQTVTLTGTTVVPIPTALWRVFRMKNEGATDNAGIIHASDAGKAVSYAQIQAGNNQTLMALYTVPLGKKAYMYQVDESLVGTTRAYTVASRMTFRKFGKVHQIKRTFALSSDGTSALVKVYQAPIEISALTDIRISAISSAVNGGMNAGFLLVIEPE